MVYSFELIKHANIRYRESIVSLARFELSVMLRSIGISAGISDMFIGGSHFLVFESRELSEKEILEKLEASFGASSTGYADSLRELKQLYITYRTMESIEHTENPLDNHFCVNLNVKMRYIDPLVLAGSSAKPISSVSPKAHSIIEDFLSWHDKPWGCVPIATDK